MRKRARQPEQLTASQTTRPSGLDLTIAGRFCPRPQAQNISRIVNAGLTEKSGLIVFTLIAICQHRLRQCLHFAPGKASFQTLPYKTSVVVLLVVKFDDLPHFVHRGGIADLINQI